MGKNILKDIYACAKELVERHPKVAQKVLAATYMGGDGMILAMPAVEKGFFNTLYAGTPNWRLLENAYLDHPVPAIVSVIFIASAAVMAKSFSKGHAASLIGSSLLAIDLAYHSEIGPAIALLPSLFAAGFGSIYAPLERVFGNTKRVFLRESLGKPKRLTGGLFFAGNIPIMILAALSTPPDIGLCAAAGTWLAGNIVSMLLPKDRIAHPQRPSITTSQRRDPSGSHIG